MVPVMYAYVGVNLRMLVFSKIGGQRLPLRVRCPPQYFSPLSFSIVSCCADPSKPRLLHQQNIIFLVRYSILCLPSIDVVVTFRGQGSPGTLSLSWCVWGNINAEPTKAGQDLATMSITPTITYMKHSKLCHDVVLCDPEFSRGSSFPCPLRCVSTRVW